MEQLKIQLIALILANQDEALLAELLALLSQSHEDFFWEVAVVSYEEGEELAIQKLATYEEEKINQFQEILTQKIEQLTEKSFICQTLHQGYFSKDAWTYAACALIGQGKETYETVLKDPKMFDFEADFEALLYLSEEALELKKEENAQEQ